MCGRQCHRLPICFLTSDLTKSKTRTKELWLWDELACLMCVYRITSCSGLNISKSGSKLARGSFANFSFNLLVFTKFDLIWCSEERLLQGKNAHLQFCFLQWVDFSFLPSLMSIWWKLFALFWAPAVAAVAKESSNVKCAEKKTNIRCCRPWIS